MQAMVDATMESFARGGGGAGGPGAGGPGGASRFGAASQLIALDELLNGLGGGLAGGDPTHGQAGDLRAPLGLMPPPPRREGDTRLGQDNAIDARRWSSMHVAGLSGGRGVHTCAVHCAVLGRRIPGLCSLLPQSLAVVLMDACIFAIASIYMIW